MYAARMRHQTQRQLVRMEPNGSAEVWCDSIIPLRAHFWPDEALGEIRCRQDESIDSRDGSGDA